MIRRRALAPLLAVAAVLLGAGVASAYLAAGSATGGGAASASTVNRGATPVANPASQSVTVTWAAGTLSNGNAVSGYVVKRYDSGGNLQTIQAGCAGTITALSCTETSVPGGQWQYTVTPVFGSNWKGQESAKSTTVAIASISLAPTSGHAGDSVSVSGSGYPASSAIAATFDGAALTLSGTATTDASGNIPSNVAFTVPVGIAGNHTVKLTAGSQNATATFTVQPHIALTPTSGGAGSSTSISGTGFAAGKSITATFNGSGVTIAGTTTTDASGSFSAATLTVPSATAPGSDSIAVTDASSNTASATYTVTFGPIAKLVLGAASTSPTAGGADNLTITAEDGAGNAVTSYTGDKSLAFGGAANAPNGTHPAVTDKGGAAVNFGTATTVTFANGVASVAAGKNGAMTLYKAGTASVTVTDGTVSNGSGLAVSVNSAGAALAFSSACATFGGKGTTCTRTVTIGNDSFGNVPQYFGTGITITLTLADGSHFSVAAGATGNASTQASATVTATGTPSGQLTVEHIDSAANKSTTLTASGPAGGGFTNASTTIGS